ncbi:hypothetical protein B0T11DRAFT_29115 [Plectosphaerella cucumerina]|uniref:Uncharacterized protein n=1 Tax=Plectosphaerella cucumerina TaxID=40658 RepID=A0A8K0TU84_9PEZI|nr:hypothetical protein B0T11DRAFT_29115 [Plectosphaerella cucumerina]
MQLVQVWKVRCRGTGFMLLGFCQDLGIISRMCGLYEGAIVAERSRQQWHRDYIIGLAIDGLKDTAGRISGVTTGSLPGSNHDNMKAMVQK